MLTPILKLLGACSLTVAAAALCSTALAQSNVTGAQDFSVQGDRYRIGPGDTLVVSVWQEPELSVTIPVRPDGRITTPLVEDLVAVGKTPTELAREIERALAVYIRSPAVSVIVEDAVGILAEQIRVIGRGIENGTVPYVNGMTVLNVVLAMGGLNEFAAGNRARVIRETEGQTEEIRVRLDDLMNRGRTTENIAVKPGDILSVPESRF